LPDRNARWRPEAVAGAQHGGGPGRRGPRRPCGGEEGRAVPIPHRRRGGDRSGPLAWTVFVLAVAAVLALVAGCAALVYGPVLTGG
jgi:hypothetical protein